MNITEKSKHSLQVALERHENLETLGSEKNGMPENGKNIPYQVITI